MKKLAMLLALCLLATMLPVGAFSEGVEDYIPEEVPPEAVGMVAEGLYAEPEGDAPDDPEDLALYEAGEPLESDLALEQEEEEPEPIADADAAVEATAEEIVADPALAEGEQAVEAVPHTDPNGPKLAANQLTLGVGETFALAGVMPEGNAATIAYASTNAAIAAVGADGVVSAVAPGDVTVTATASDGTYAECFVSVRKAPDAVSFSASSFNLGKGESTAALKVVVGSKPGEYAGGYTLSVSKKKILSIDENGVVRGNKTGKCVITVQTYNGLTAKCNVVVMKAPKKIAIEVDKPAMGIGETGQASYTLPKKTASQVIYASDKPEVVSVDAATGALKAMGQGTARISATTFNGKSASVDVTVKAAPTSLSFPSSEFVMGVGMTISSAAFVNDGAAAGIAYKIGNPAVASFEKGELKALSVGETELTASTYNGLTATCKLVVRSKPAFVRLPYKTLNIYVGDTVQLIPDVGDSASTFTYATSSKKKVSVTPEGVIKGLAKGKSTITIKTYNKKKFKLKVVVTNKPALPSNPDTELPVNLDAVTLTIPARTTDVGGISGNLKKIDDIRVSAQGQIEAMRVAGIITDADASKRKSMVNNAFADYAFPWMTPAYQEYWKAANSEGGVKDFQPNRVYYGLPYISGTGKNRLYNAARALSEARYTSSGNGYYLLNQKNLVNKKYCGNDCSGFVDAAIWGTGKSHSSDRTTEIAKSNVYRTISDYGCLRTGDLICKSGAHVVMFLYYAAADKSKIMIIENGGSEPGTNTVHCIIMDTAYYQAKGYSVRRLATLG